MSLVQTNHRLPQDIVPVRVGHVCANHIICFIDRLTGISVKATAERLDLGVSTVNQYAVNCSAYLRQNDVNLSVYSQWQRALMPAAIKSLAYHLDRNTKEVLIKYMEGNGVWSKNISIKSVSLTATIPELKASINAEASHDPSVQAALSDIQGALSDDPGALGDALDGTVIDDEGMMHVESTCPAPGVVGEEPEGSGFDSGSACAGGRETGSSLTSKNSEKKVNMDSSLDDQQSLLRFAPSSSDDPQSGSENPGVSCVDGPARGTLGGERGAEVIATAVVSSSLEPPESSGGGSETIRNPIRNSSGDDPRSMSTNHESVSTAHCLASPDVSRETIRNDIRKKPEPQPKDLYTGLKVGENFIDANGMKRKVTAVNPLESKLLRRKMRRGVNGKDRGKKAKKFGVK